MQAKINGTTMNGVYIISSESFIDSRGLFMKTFHSDFFRKNKMKYDFKEDFFSISDKNVIRGMHFQNPPCDYEKLVYCVKGSVLDVLIDLRKDSSTYGRHAEFDLAGADGKLIYIPKGVAHGFCSLEDGTIMMYKVSALYSPEHDSGILWNSFGFEWPVSNPVISARDMSLQSFEKFNSPF